MGWRMHRAQIAVVLFQGSEQTAVVLFRICGWAARGGQRLMGLAAADC